MMAVDGQSRGSQRSAWSGIKMKFVFGTFLIALLWMSALASNSGEGGSASDEKDDNGGDSHPSSENDLDQGIDRHIINGQPVRNIDVPFQCLVLFQNRLCGCVIISPNWVLTVTSCIERGQTVTVVAGITYLADINNPARRTMRTVPPGRITFYPGFNVSNVFSDNLAALRIVPPFPTNLATVQPIRLTTDTSVPHRLGWQVVYASGWGVTEFSGGYASEDLRLGRMTVLPYNMCRPVNQTSRILCTVSSPSTVCFGDNGGPLFTIGSDRRPTLVGIVSLIDRYCNLRNPAGHTYLGAYRAWVRNLTGI